jgi:hypothetical protein
MSERAQALAEQFEQANNEAIAAVEGCSERAPPVPHVVGGLAAPGCDDVAAPVTTRARASTRGTGGAANNDRCARWREGDVHALGLVKPRVAWSRGPRIPRAPGEGRSPPMPRDRELDHDLTAPASYAPVPARPAGHAGVAHHVGHPQTLDGYRKAPTYPTCERVRRGMTTRAVHSMLPAQAWPIPTSPHALMSR